MTRDKLLQLASQHQDGAPAATAMARRMTCGEYVRAESNILAAQIATTKICKAVAGGIGLLCAATAYGVGMPQVLQLSFGGSGEWDVAGPLIIGAVVVFGLSVLLVTFFTDRARALHEQLALLKPVVDATACARALKFVEKGFPAVLEWRDLAIAERGQLSEFDVLVLQDIYYASKAAQADSAARSKL